MRRILFPVRCQFLSSPLCVISNLTSDDLDLSDTVRIPEHDTDLGGCGSFTGELDDLVDDLVGGGLQPRRRSAAVGDGRGRNALAVAVHATHFGVGLMSTGRCEGCCCRFAVRSGEV
jgi:hypothetical protein